MSGLNTDLVEQLAFYGAYHTNKINQLVHLVFVPMIWMTAILWSCYVPLAAVTPKDMLLAAGIEAPSLLVDYIDFNLGFLAFVCYAGYYLLLDPMAAIFADSILFALYVLANIWVKLDPNNAWKWGLFLHALSWLVQVYVGHLVFEKRKPALLDSLFQSLILAPLFVCYEVLWPLGYGRATHRKVQHRIKELHAVMKRKENQAKGA